MNLIVLLTLLVAIVHGHDDSKPKVVIIGAGPSGIAAGRRLYENGFSVTILEAENRIGGRIHSVFFGDAYVDLGAQWCHGEGGNIVFQMVKEMGVLHHSNFDYHFYFSDRNYISDDFNKELFDLFEAVYTADGNRHQPVDTTVGEYCIRAFNSSIRENWSDDKEKFRIAMMGLETYHRLALSDEGAFTWFQAVATNGYRNCEGDLELNWGGRGYKTILEILLKKFPVVDTRFHLDRHIELNKEVIEIIYRDDFAIALCDDGSAYQADHIIFTPSLGVLKHYHREIFNPPLSAEKAQVIDDLGISAVSKVIVQFPWRWWPADPSFTGWTFVWTYEAKEMLPVEFPFGPARNDQHWLRDIMSVYRLEENPRAMTVWFTGEYVPHIELMNEEILINGIVFLFEKFFGDIYTIPRPDQLIRTDWYMNHHFHGSYSYQTVAANEHFSPSPNLVLAEPIFNQAKIPRLQFAGEATNPHHYSTVHGAIETGFREADRLIQIYKK